MDDNFSPRVKEVLSHSKDEALRLGHDFIGTEHLLLGILKDGSGKAISILDQLDIENQQTSWTASTWILTVRQIGWNPKTAFLARNH